MAKADGRVTRDEVTAFREVFRIAAQDEAGAAKVVQPCTSGCGGFEEYAQRIGTMFSGSRKHCAIFSRVVSYRNGGWLLSSQRERFSGKGDQHFWHTEIEFSTLRMRFAPDAPQDPYTVLGVTPDTPIEEIRQVFRRLVRENHPDAMIARGVPKKRCNLRKTHV